MESTLNSEVCQLCRAVAEEQDPDRIKILLDDLLQVLNERESIENALRRFKRKAQTEQIIKEVKRHSFYLTPGAKRGVKEALARERAGKKIRREPD